MFPCPKAQVRAIITGKSGRHYYGGNDIRNPVTACPRLKGEGYSKCKAICDQPHHAEMGALEEAGDDASGGTLMLSGINRVCAACADALAEAGISNIEFIGNRRGDNADA